ncbi:MAG: S9 family peptidase [Clostridia bacterium]|nr:S9 family peptidase [Clostridia bacterium]
MKKITLDEFSNLAFLSSPTFSPAGKHFCFVMSHADKHENKYTADIYELKGKKLRRITSGGKERGFQFLDEDTILFPGDREGKKEPTIETKFYQISLSGGEATLAFRFPLPVEKLLPLPDGNFIVAATTFPGWEDLYKADPKRTAAYLKEMKENEDYEVVDQVPWWWNGGGVTKSAYTALYYFDAKKKKAAMLTEKNFAVSDVKLSPDKSTVWFFGSECKPLLSMEEGIGLYKMALADKKITCVAENNAHFSVQGFECAESFLLLMASDRSHGLNTDADFYKLSYEDEKITLYKTYGEAIGSSVGSDVRYGGGRSLKVIGDTVYFISTIFDSADLYKLEDGEITKVTDVEGSVDSFDVAGDKLRLIALWNMKAQEIYDEKGTQYTRVNEKALAGKYIASPEKLNFVTDGHEVHGFVLKPIDYEEGKKYPVVFDIHGGPKTVYGPVFYHEMQYWTSLGYFVIYCNPTGSDGRNAFADIRGKYGTVDYEDLMAFCDEALKAYPDMDEKNVFETGGSYGGFMTNWIIGHTDRFAACASQRSISNWFSFYGVSDIGVEFAKDQNAADPWGDPEKLWWHSPLRYADKVKTPTLFIHSFEDYRCPIDQGYQMYTALIAHGVESKMVLFKGENHELSRSGKPLHRIRRLDEITKWFENHKR